MVAGRARWAVAVGLASGLGCTQLLGADWTGYFVPDAGVDAVTVKLDGGKRDAERKVDASQEDVSVTGDALVASDVDASDGPLRQSCSVTDAGDECLCFVEQSTVLVANDAACSPSLLLDPSRCCRNPSFCYCYAFLCYTDLDVPGGFDCSFDDREDDPILFGDGSTSATGDVCCIDPPSDSGFARYCHCYPASGAYKCSGLIDAGKTCTIDSLPACSGYDEQDATPVPACR